MQSEARDPTGVELQELSQMETEEATHSVGALSLAASTKTLSEDERILLKEEWLIPTSTELKITDTHIRGTTKYSLRCCCCCRSESYRQWDSELNAINAISTTQPSDAGLLAFVAVYLCWFFLGIFGGHYWVYSSKFAQTWRHKLFLFVWACTLGFFGLGWLIDAYRVYFWVGSYTIIFHGELDRNTWQLDVREGRIVTRIRDAVYTAMARTRQLDPDKIAETISRLSWKEQIEKAPSDTVTKGYGIGGKGKVTMVVTKDRVLLERYYPGCCGNGNVKYEWEAIFLKDIEGIEITKPAQWPTWWAWVNFFPPQGCFAKHRMVLGEKSSAVIWLYRCTLGFFGVGYLLDFFVMCCCIDRLRTKGTISIVGRQRSVEIAMRVKSPEEAQKMKTTIKREIGRLPGCHFANPLLQAKFHHIQMTCPLECCKKYEEYTEQDTNIDSVSLSVVETHKTKPKKPTIPPSLCCPICWCSLIKCLFRVCLPTIRATDVHEQDVFHHSGTETTNVYYMPNSDMNSLLRTWLMCGLFGGHLFKAGRFKEGACRIVLWCLIVFIIVGFIGIIVAAAVIAGGQSRSVYSGTSRCPKNSYCPDAGEFSLCDVSECEACPSGKFSLSGSTSKDECEPFRRYFVATSGQCEDVQGGVTITSDWECKSALSALDYRLTPGEELCTEGCAQSSMPQGCLDSNGWGPTLNPFRQPLSVECGKRDGISESADCICKGGSCPKNSYCPSASGFCGDLSECEACPAGKFSRSGSTRESECTEYFVATSGQCEDVQGGSTITSDWECKHALRLLDYSVDFERALCTDACAQYSMPQGCLDSNGWGPILNPLRQTVECGKRDGISESADCICKSGSCPKNSYCPSASGFCGDLSECEACPAGKFSRIGSTNEYNCGEYFVATSGQCEDVQGGVTITSDWECKSALSALDYRLTPGEELCTEGCAQSSMPRGCLDSTRWGPVLNTQPGQGAECGKRDGISTSANCLCGAEDNPNGGRRLRQRNILSTKISQSRNESQNEKQFPSSSIPTQSRQSMVRRSQNDGFVEKPNFHTMSFRKNSNISARGNAVKEWHSGMLIKAMKYSAQLGKIWNRLNEARGYQTRIMPTWFYIEPEPENTEPGGTKANNDTICHSWMRSKAAGHFGNTTSPPPKRRYLVVEDPQYSDINITIQIIGNIMDIMYKSGLGIFGVLVTLWLSDLFRLRGFLNSTHVEFSSVQSFGYMWAKPWACYLNNKDEARQLMDMMHELNRSHNVYGMPQSTRERLELNRLNAIQKKRGKKQGSEKSSETNQIN